MTSSKALIFGSGAQGRIVLDILRAQGSHHEIEFVDDNRDVWGKKINGVRVGGGLEYTSDQDREHCEVIVAINHPSRRLDVVDRLRARGVRFFNAVHPAAVIAPSASMGVGNTLSAGAIVNTDASLGDHILINTGAIVEHDCVVANGTSLSPGVILGGRVTIEQRAFLGLRALVQPRLTIGRDAMVAAGSVVTMDVPDQVLVAGVPARMLARVDESFDWSRALQNRGEFDLRFLSSGTLLHVLFPPRPCDYNFVQLYRHEVLESDRIEARSTAFVTPELMIRVFDQGFRIKEMPIERHPPHLTSTND